MSFIEQTKHLRNLIPKKKGKDKITIHKLLNKFLTHFKIRYFEK